jgi:hypothetical protein
VVASFDPSTTTVIVGVVPDAAVTATVTVATEAVFVSRLVCVVEVVSAAEAFVSPNEPRLRPELEK